MYEVFLGIFHVGIKCVGINWIPEDVGDEICLEINCVGINWIGILWGLLEWTIDVLLDDLSIFFFLKDEKINF